MTAILNVPVRDEVEVSTKARRRQFSAKYKLEILRRASACTQPGAIGALLRSEGLFSSHLTTWRQARERGELDGLAPKMRGRKAVPRDARDKKIAELGFVPVALTLDREDGRVHPFGGQVSSELRSGLREVELISRQASQQTLNHPLEPKRTGRRELLDRLFKHPQTSELR